MRASCLVTCPSGLLPPGQVLVLHASLGLLLCLLWEQGEPRHMSVQPLTLEEGRALVPLLQAFPASAPHAPVLASIQHSRRGGTALAEHRLAARRGGMDSILQPLRTVLGSLCRKLYACRSALVAVQRRGSLLKQWKEQP